MKINIIASLVSQSSILLKIEKFILFQFHDLERSLKQISRDTIFWCPPENISPFNDLLLKKWNPFSTIRNQIGNGIRFYTSKIQIQDAIFKFIWEMRNNEHIKRYGSAFENHVTESLKIGSKLDLIADKYFNSLQYDQFLYADPLLFVIDIKDLKLISDPQERKRIYSRKAELKGYCEYLKIKTRKIIDNFDEFSHKFPSFSNAKFFIPLLITNTPVLYFTFHQVAIISLSEFIKIHMEVVKYARLGQKKIIIWNSDGGRPEIEYDFRFNVIDGNS